MRESLLKWIGDADALRHLDRFNVPETPLALGYQRSRKDDLYLALVGELFDRMRDGAAQPADWARLGNALAQYAVPDRATEMQALGISQAEASLFASAAFYLGGFPASAYLTIKGRRGPFANDEERACFELLAKPSEVASRYIRELHGALWGGALDTVAAIEQNVSASASAALAAGPEAWIPLRLLERLVSRFRSTNLRAVLPEGGSEFWTPLVTSFVRRGTWEFFPSQIAAIQRGLLVRDETFSLQMPTGAGKTALCETLLFYHLRANEDSAAVLIVPYRSLASELRGSLVRRLNEMGISARCAYGGTVPSGDEVRAFDETRALVATPETLSGILTANPLFAMRVSLVICDEGHLLDAPSRGVSLELLLARMKARQTGVQRYVFVSAIVPNVEEINSWLGGPEDSVVRSDYRPAIAEFSVLRRAGTAVDLEVHPHEQPPIRYRIERFLRTEDFQWVNTTTGRRNTYQFTSTSTRSIAAARKALTMGAAVVFAANKRGNQGAIGLTEELLNQLENPLPLPVPLGFADRNAVGLAADYLQRQYGEDWVGTRALRAGAVLHHGDIPQETREVLERLLRHSQVSLGICTSTLAEGVNLPIRTLVLYSVQRLEEDGARKDLLTRDIKNLVGRAGRAGSTTRGLVICANENQWNLVAAVARQEPGEPVTGALRSLIQAVRVRLAARRVQLSNELLERSPGVHSLVDGIDATLVDLAAAEIGEDELLRIATDLANQTFASRQMDEPAKQLLRDVFVLRARRVFAMKNAGRMDWIRETGTRVRMVDLVERELLPSRPTWDDVADPTDPSFVNPLLLWAWNQPELQRAVQEAYRVEPQETGRLRESFLNTVRLWVSGANFVTLAQAAGLSVDEMLGVHSRVIGYALQTVVEQGIALLEKLLLSRTQVVAPAVLQFPEYLRFGVSSPVACALAAGGIRHRSACVALGNTEELREFPPEDRNALFRAAKDQIEANRQDWEARLGALVAQNTTRDLTLGVRAQAEDE